MRKEGYCAYGAARTSETVQALQAGISASTGDDLQSVEAALTAAHRLQTCLTLFRACYPKTRVALWKRRLRRLIRALNAQRDALRLIEWIHALSPSREHKVGIQRALLRLTQELDTRQSRVQDVWRQWLDSRAPNEILGLSRRWIEAFGDEPCDCDFAQRQWTLFARAQQSALEEGSAQSLAVRCGRLRALIEGCALLEPLMGCKLETAWAESYETLERARWKSDTCQLLSDLLERERALTTRYAGHLRGFTRLRRGWEWLIQQLTSL
ncbi:MAG: CHAD domain-containing protein [Fimbriimonadales bacterium]|nr:CHAD domain-containing protein [Fimbriimonadales bacterium]